MTVAVLVASGMLGVTPAATQAATGASPCDAFPAGGTPCVASFSTVPALYASYDGPLYQVTRASDGCRSSR